MNDQRRLILQQRALDALRERIERDSYLSVGAVVKRLGISRSKVEALPEEVLPYVNLGTGKKSMRRYHPADVLAADALLRAWTRARDRGAEAEFLERRRAELEERDRLALEVAAGRSIA